VLSSPAMIHGGVEWMMSVVAVAVLLVMVVVVVVPNTRRLRIVLERVLVLVVDYDPVGVLVVDSVDLEDVLDVDNDETLVLDLASLVPVTAQVNTEA